MKKGLICSVLVLALMVGIGFGINAGIKSSNEKNTREYNSSVKITSEEDFSSALKEEGHFYAYGDLLAVDPVSDPKYGGEYSCVTIVEKIEEKTRDEGYYYDADGERHWRDAEYEWRTIDEEEYHCSGFTFLSQSLKYNDIKLPGSRSIDTERVSSRHKFEHYGNAVKYTGTLSGDIENGQITNLKFHNDKTIESMAPMSLKTAQTIFWVIWSLVSIGAAVLFFFTIGQGFDD